MSKAINDSGVDESYTAANGIVSNERRDILPPF